MRVAVVSPHPLWPARAGDGVRADNLLRELGVLGAEVHVIQAGYDEAAPGPTEAVTVTGRPRRPVGRLAWRAWLASARLADPYAIHRWPPLRRRLRAALKAVRPDVVDFQHTFSWFPVPYPTVVTVIDVNSHRLAREGELSGLGGRRLAAMERASCSGADVAVTLSDLDARRLRSLVGPDPTIVTVPLGHDPGGAPFTVRRHARTAAFVGSFGYGPNRAAAQALLDRWPVVRASGGFDTLLVVGRGAATHVRPSATVEVRSDVHDMRTALADADVLIVPLVSGGGVRVKIIEAMAMGLPIVSTAVGVEGLEIDDGVHAAIVTDVDAIADGCQRMRSLSTRATMAAAARLQWERSHRPAHMAELMMDAYELAIAKASLPSRTSRHDTAPVARTVTP